MYVCIYVFIYVCIWKQAIRSGRIVELADEKPSREFTNLDYYITCDFTEENWENFVVEDSAFRKQLASKKVEYNRVRETTSYGSRLFS